MSKQYLTTHTIDGAHPTDIFAVAPTPTALLSASGASTLHVHSTARPDAAPLQSLAGAHKLGCHHLAAAGTGRVAASAGFGGEVKIWRLDEEGGGAEGRWRLAGRVADADRAGEMWAVAVDGEGRYLSAAAYDGRVCVWDLRGGGEEEWNKVREYETKGSFGMCVAMTLDGRFTASGHENGNVYIFNNDSGRMLHSLPGLIKAVRAVAFSPAATLLAAAGDSRIIALYDISSGEQVANLSGHASWVMSLDFSSTGEWLLSGCYDGKVKVWGMETRGCVATHGESDKPIWSVKWLPRFGRGEMFVAAGAARSISFYREASGG